MSSAAVMGTIGAGAVTVILSLRQISGVVVAVGSRRGTAFYIADGVTLGKVGNTVMAV